MNRTSVRTCWISSTWWVVTTIGAVAVEVVAEQRIVELLAVEDVEPERRLVEHQQPRVDRHDHREVQLRRPCPWRAPGPSARPDGGLRQEALRLGAVEPRVHAGDVVERLRDPDPARQHGDVGDEADVAHEPIALGPGVAPEHLQLVPGTA